ncbi:hypothetical protein CKO28_05970 [Rhodovibrio sodomensis]|uniref:Metalloprotease n=1 Tax=Rhodovibrio sodomensis TaxID=1088 RepID=A0ABS1DDA4_9PROT|nr:hypothetical protein [Rhodovibrio sodomensis]MBK1667578.1 hypothetical protein [Rhodovibrio sodomensis]
MDRRTVLQIVATTLAATGLGCTCARAGFPGLPQQDTETRWVDPSDRPERDDKSASPEAPADRDEGLEAGLRDLKVCALTSGQAGRLARTKGFSRASGIPQLDGTLNSEPPVLRDLFGVDPGFAFFNDGRAINAYAMPQNILRRRGDGTVVFGRNLLRTEIAKASQLMRGPNAWATAVIGIFAHEWGHIRQFSDVGQLDKPLMELHADYLAGWYLGTKSSYGSSLDIAGIARSLYEKGDSNFNSPPDHGRPIQRVKSMEAGFLLGRRRAPVSDAFRAGLDALS